MKKVETWFRDYSADHWNPFNQKVHYVCVPLIGYSVTGLLWSIPQLQILGFQMNWTIPIILGLSLFYLLLNIKLGLIMGVILSLMSLSFYYIAPHVSVVYLSLGIFVLAWLGQFYGHVVEGKRPSFFTDLTYLFIGPLWILVKAFPFILKRTNHTSITLKAH